jgi:predicted alpha/beta superfamily hydrolase
MYRINVTILKAVLFSVMLGATFGSLTHAQQEISIESESMQDTREIVVHLPKNYDADREEGYPVIYMLDAGSTDRLTAEMAGFYHWGDLTPELIVIGLKNVRRGLDFLPGYYSVEREGEQVFGSGTNLLAYISNELIPFADKQFNTNGRKVFVGHSWGGQFATYALSQSPGIFDAYFITSPAFGRWSQKTFDALEQTLKQDQSFPNLIYLSVGGDGSPGPLTDSVLLPEYYRLTALLRQHLPEGVRLHHEVHDNANHTSNSAISIAKAMQLYFAASPAAE